MIFSFNNTDLIQGLKGADEEYLTMNKSIYFAALGNPRVDMQRKDGV